MSSLLSDEPLSLNLLQQELGRLTSQHSTHQSDAYEDRTGDHLCERVVSSSSKLLSCSDAITTKEAAEAYMTIASEMLDSMQRLLILASKLREKVENTAENNESHTVNKAVPLPLQLSQCIEAWAKWVAHVSRLPHFYASCIVVRIFALLTSPSAHSSSQAHERFFEKTIAVILQLLLRASQTFPQEVADRCLPPHSLQPPWKVLITCAQYSWAWDRLCALVEVPENKNSTVSMNSRAVGNDQFQRKKVNASLLEIQERVELAHASHVAREVLLFSYDSINWKAGNAVPNIKSVAPPMWCFFLRCRSIALHGLTEQNNSVFSSLYFQDGISRRLTARMLQNFLDGIRSCLTRNATGMHADRMAQLATRDVPCLILFTRLWYLYLQPYPTLLKAVHASLVVLVNTAMEVCNPVAVNEASIVVNTDLGTENSKLHMRSDNADEAEEKSMINEVRARCFRDIVWNVTPLLEHEIVSDAAGVPWGSSFPRAEAIQAILDARVTVSAVE